VPPTHAHILVSVRPGTPLLLDGHPVATDERDRFSAGRKRRGTCFSCTSSSPRSPWPRGCLGRSAGAVVEGRPALAKRDERKLTR
jgi:hypothetical protein